MGTYITPRLNKFDPNISDLCYKCNTHKGTLYHCLQDCKEIKIFWSFVVRYISQITSSSIPLCPKLCILSIYPENCTLSNKEKKMVDLCLFQARCSLALCWKNVNCPSIGLWLKNLVSSLALERLTYVLKKKIHEFYNSWEIFLDFIKRANIEEALQI